MRTRLALLTALLPVPLLAQTTPAATVLHVKDESGSSLLKVDANGALLGRGTFTGGNQGSGPIPEDGAGTRMMWYPYRAAFRAGGLNGTQWDDAIIGDYSAAFGYNARASGDYAFAAGQDVTAAQINSVALGHNVTANGSASVALGYYASTNARQGSFVFGDRSTTTVHSVTLNHSFNVRASGGYWLWTNSGTTTGLRLSHGTTTNAAYGSFVWSDRSSETAVTPTTQNQTIFRSSGGYHLYTNTDLTAGVSLAAGAGSWSTVSDRNRKEHFADVDGEALLQALRRVPVTTWNYKAQDAGTRHLGPMAQDFHAAFGLSGSDSLLINTGDIDGVNLAGVKALDVRTEALQRENAVLREELAALRVEITTLRAERSTSAALAARLDRLEALFARTNVTTGPPRD